MSKQSFILSWAVALSLSAGSASAEDVVRIASANQVTSLDPITSAAAGNIEAYGQLFTRLLRQNANGKLELGLAESWTVSENGLVYQFELREAKFSDGSAITAEDAPFDNLNVRKAAAMALNRESIAKVATLGRAELANSTLPSALTYHSKDIKPPAYDPRKARALLEAEGAIGVEIVMMITPGNEQLATLYKPLMAAHGLDNQLRELQASGYATDPQYAAKVGRIARSIGGKKTAARASAPTRIQTGQASGQRAGQLFPDRLMQILLSPYVDAPTKSLFVKEFQRKSTPVEMTDFQRQWQLFRQNPEAYKQFKTVGKGPEKPSDWQLFQQNPEAYKQFKAAGRGPGTNVTINTGKQGQQYPGLSKAPTGYSYVYGNDGKIVMENNLPVLRALPGGPQAQKEKELKEKERQRLQEKRNTNAIVLEDIDRALEKIQAAGLPSTGIFGQILGDVGGTNAHNLSTILDSIRANIGFDQSILVSLDASQDEEELIFDLNRLKRLFSETDLFDRIENTLANPPKPNNVQQSDWDYMTLGEKRQFYKLENN